MTETIQGESKLPLATKLGFGAGDIFGGGALVVVGFYYLYFLTDVIRINPALAGIVFLVSKAWDAVSDPLMGIISDRTRTRWGRRRPYFLIGVILVFLSFFLMWRPVSYNREIYRFAYALFTYIFYSTVYTLVWIPYNALSSELTLDYDERTSLSSYRIFFSTLSSIVCAVAPLEIVKMFNDKTTGYTAMGLILGVFFALPYLAVFFTTKERVEFRPVSEKPSLKTFTAPFKIKAFRRVLGMYLFAFVAMDTLMTIVIYFMTYYILQGDQTNYVLGTMLVVQIISIPFYYKLSKRTSKKAGYMTAACIWCITMLFSLFLGPGLPVFLVYLFSAFIGSGTGGIIVMIFSILPDIPDIDELNTSQRQEGVYSGLFTFMRKLSSALAIFLISNAIMLAGYKAPIEQTVEGVIEVVKQTQSTEFILILRLVFAFLPFAFLIIGLMFARRYPLSHEVHARLRGYLEKKRAGIEPDEEMKKDEADLKSILIGQP